VFETAHDCDKCKENDVILELHFHKNEFKGIKEQYITICNVIFSLVGLFGLQN